MNTVTILRILVVCEMLIVPIVRFALNYVMDVPEEIADYESRSGEEYLEKTGLIMSGPYRVLYLIYALGLSFLGIFALIGLLRLQPLSRWLFLSFVIFVAPHQLLQGYSIDSPVERVFDSLAMLIPGLILGISFFSDALMSDEKSHSDPFL